MADFTTTHTAHPGHAGSAATQSVAEAAKQAFSRVAELARTTLQTEASLAKQSVQLTWEVVAGDLDRASANKAYVESVTREGARYWRAVGELGLDFANDLVGLGKVLSTTVLRETAAAGRKPGTRHKSNATAGSTRSTRQHSRPERGSRRLVEVSLHGSVGGRAKGTVTVANKHPRPRRIQLIPGDLLDSAGVAIAGKLDASPASVTVPSGKERSVSLGVDLDEASFSAGKRYFGTVEVSGGDEATIEVTIIVNA